MNDESHELSHRRQFTATLDALDGYAVGEYEPYQHMESAEAVAKLDAGTHWVRSANLEFYYRYATVEDADTGQRFVVRKLTEEQWAIVLRWLADPDADTTVAYDPSRKEGGT